MEYSIEELIKIAEKATSFYERISGDFSFVQNSDSDQEIESRLRRWQRIVANGEEKLFSKRLAWDGLNLDTVRNVLRGVSYNNRNDLPDWLCTLQAVLKLINGDDNEVDTLIDESELLPFEEMFTPFASVSVERLLSKTNGLEAGLSHTALTMLKRNLLKRLAKMGAIIFYYEFTKYKLAQKTLEPAGSIYNSFIKLMLTGGITVIFKQYPVLTKLLCVIADQWVESTYEFLLHLHEDRAELEGVFNKGRQVGQVVSVEAGISDAHNHGRTVIALEFASGLRLVYKPRDLSVEIVFGEIVDWVKNCRLKPYLKTPKVLNKVNHGWVESVKQIACKDEKEVVRYFKRAGMILGLLYIFHGTDCHYENIIANGQYPVIVDLEMLFNPFVPTSQGVSYDIESSVLRTGMLPIHEESGENQGMSGLSGERELTTTFQEIKWNQINTDEMSFEYAHQKVPPKKNLVYLDGEVVPPSKYKKEIILGFQMIYRFFLKHREEILNDVFLDKFNELRVRFVYRPTKLYYLTTNITVIPTFVKDGIDRFIELDRLCKNLLIYDHCPAEWSIFHEELEALERLDVPYFSYEVNEDSLQINSTKMVTQFFKNTAQEFVKLRISNLSIADMQKQSVMIELNMSGNEETIEREDVISGEAIKREKLIESRNQLEEKSDNKNFLSEPGNRETKSVKLNGKETEVGRSVMGSTGERRINNGTLKKELLNKAKEIGEMVIRVYSISRSFSLQAGYNLYAGSLGIAVFLAALAQVTGKDIYRDSTIKEIEILQNKFINTSAKEYTDRYGIGVAAGLGSLVYALVKISKFLEEPYIIDEAVRIAKMISPQRISKDQLFDIVGGSAGAILGLLALYTVTKNAEFLNQAVFCGNHLIDHRVENATGYRAWKNGIIKTPEGKLLTGFSHGASGIAYALFRLFEVTDDQRFRAAGDEAIAYESKVFSSKVGNWPDYRLTFMSNGNPNFMNSWCHGAAGIGLARLSILGISGGHDRRDDLMVALARVKEADIEGVDHLCCGNFGRVELLLSVARKLADNELYMEALCKTEKILARERQYGKFALSTNITEYGFFQGISGIGYELLRLVNPDKIPSILLFE